jgi:hypothetical protein
MKFKSRGCPPRFVLDSRPATTREKIRHLWDTWKWVSNLKIPSMRRVFPSSPEYDDAPFEEMIVSHDEVCHLSHELPEI